MARCISAYCIIGVVMTLSSFFRKIFKTIDRNLYLIDLDEFVPQPRTHVLAKQDAETLSLMLDQHRDEIDESKEQQLSKRTNGIIKNCEPFVAMNGGVIEGYISIMCNTFFNDHYTGIRLNILPDEGLLFDVYTFSGCRGHKTGTDMVSYCLELLKNRGKRTALIMADIDNTYSIKMILKNGMHMDRVYRCYYFLGKALFSRLKSPQRGSLQI